MVRTKKLFDTVAVIIPAYRESRNLRLLLPRVIQTVPGATIIIVDDSDAPEAKLTNIVVKDLGYRRVFVINRVLKSGRGSAVLEGLRYAFKNKYIENFIEMDADLAHAPEESVLLLEAAENSDMVIGSRYLHNSAIKNWPIYRLIQSKIINYILVYWLGLRISDYTNGFRLYTRQVVEFLLHTKLKENGFIALSEIAYKVKKQGFSISEVPISFSDRQYGKSNADFKELMQSLFGVIRIRFS